MLKDLFVAFTLLAVLASPVYAGSPSYSDLDSYLEHFTAVEEVSSWGWFSGNEDGTFAGERSMNRAELAKVILFAAGMNEADLQACLEEDDVSQFKDVQPNEWYADYVYCAYLQGWVDGGVDAYYRPGDKVNVAEAFKTITLAMHDIPQSFYDKEGAEWYDVYFSYLDGANIINKEFPFDTNWHFKYSGSYLGDPSHEISRAEVAELLYRLSFEYGDYNPYERLDSSTALGTLADDGTLSVVSEEYGFSLESFPTGPFGVEDWRVFLRNPSGYALGYVTHLHFVFPSHVGHLEEDDGFGGGFKVSVYDKDYFHEILSEETSTDLREGRMPNLFEQGAYVYSFSCGDGVYFGNLAENLVELCRQDAREVFHFQGFWE